MSKPKDLNDELARVQRERALYLRLLDLGAETELEPFLNEALGLVVEATKSQEGYIELYDATGESRWRLSHGFTAEQEASVRDSISRGIIAEAVAQGVTVTTPSALLDERFQGRESIRLGRIASVLCAPIGGSPPRGVLYLHRDEQHDPFDEDDRSCAEVVARHLTPFVDHVVALRSRRSSEDPTAELRVRFDFTPVIGRSKALAAALEQVALVAPLNVHVLLTGESGTGKSQMAQLIHANSPRAEHALVELNCAALPEGLVESELFGALPGAHSTATEARPGRLVAAAGGTLLLDEIGELSPTAQAKLLQFLQSKEYYPLGSARPRKADVRVVAATNADLEQAVAAGRFRQDLFYRLQVLPIRVPSLAERVEDIAELAANFCDKACERHSLPRLRLSPSAIRALESAEWPGNIRQLAHTVEAAAIRAAGLGHTEVGRENLFPDAEGSSRKEPDTATFQQATRRFQAELLRKMLKENDWNVTETARRLDLARSHVYNLIGAFGLDRERD